MTLVRRQSGKSLMKIIYNKGSTPCGATTKIPYWLEDLVLLSKMFQIKSLQLELVYVLMLRMTTHVSRVRHVSKLV